MTYPSPILAFACIGLLTLASMGCGNSDSSANARAQIDFNYSPEETLDDTGLTIAAVDTTMTNPDVVPPAPGDDAPAYAVAADGYTVQAQMQIQLMDPDATAKRFRALYERDYGARLEDAANKTVDGILKQKGFEVLHVDAFKDVVNDDGARAFLASLPSFTLGFGNETDSRECANNVCTQKGRLLIDGQYLYQMVEPLTGTTVAYRRMNLYGLRIEEPYVIQTYEQGPGTVTKVKRMLGMNDGLKDTSQQALVTGLNKIYQQTMAETDLTISRPRLLALKSTLQELKQPE